MIRSYPWSRYEVAHVRHPNLRRVLALVLIGAVLLYLAAHFLGVDWSQLQAIPLLDLGAHRWELFWSPAQTVTALHHHDLASGQVSNMIQVSWR